MTDSADSADRVEELLSTSFMESHPRDAAEVLESLSADDAATILASVPPNVGAPVLQNMAPLAATDCLTAFPLPVGGAVLAKLPLDVAADLLRKVEPTSRTELLARTATDRRRSLELLLQYPKDAAGALMEPRVLALPEDLTVAEARKQIRRQSRALRFYLYVNNRAQTLIGVLSLRELMLAAPDRSLSSLMTRNPDRISVNESARAIVTHPGWQRFHALPVVDPQGRLVGVIRYETVRHLEGRDASEAVPNFSGLAISLAELYWVGATGVTRHLLDALGPVAKTQPKEEGDVI